MSICYFVEMLNNIIIQHITTMLQQCYMFAVLDTFVGRWKQKVFMLGAEAQTLKTALDSRGVPTASYLFFKCNTCVKDKIVSIDLRCCFMLSVVLSLSLLRLLYVPQAST